MRLAVYDVDGRLMLVTPGARMGRGEMHGMGGGGDGASPITAARDGRMDGPAYSGARGRAQARDGRDPRVRGDLTPCQRCLPRDVLLYLGLAGDVAAIADHTVRALASRRITWRLKPRTDCRST